MNKKVHVVTTMLIYAVIVEGFIFSEVCHSCSFQFLAFILYCCLPLTMFKLYTGQCYGHWVDKSYCPWFIYPFVVGLVLIRL